MANLPPRKPNAPKLKPKPPLGAKPEEALPPGLAEAAARAVERAKANMARFKAGEGHTPPVGTRLTLNDVDYVFFLIGAIPLSIAAYAAFNGIVTGQSGLFAVAAFVSFFGLLFVGLGVLNALYWAPTTPERALKQFYRCIRLSMARTAARYVVPLDFDDSERPNPVALGAGQFVPVENGLADAAAMKRYWREVLKALKLQPTSFLFQGVLVLPVNDDVVVAKVSLRSTTISAWSAVTAIGGVYVTNNRDMELTRLVVRDGTEWRLWSGEWLSLAELDLNWLKEI